MSLSSIGFKAFSFTGLVTIDLPASVSSVGIGFINHCEYIKNITVHPSNAFFKSYKGSLYSSNYDRIIASPTGIIQNTYSLINKTKCIGPYAFAYSPLDTLYLPPRLERIEAFAFYCSFITNLFYPTSLSSIGSHAFKHCEFLESAYLSNTNLTTIGDKAYEYCSKMAEVSFPSSLVSVGTRAFASCTLLKYVTYNGDKELSGDRVFEDCPCEPEAHVSKNFPVSTLAGLRVEAGTLSSN
jgi:hypothetical protein